MKKKLRLKRRTIRTLVDRDLDQAVGAAGGEPVPLPGPIVILPTASCITCWTPTVCRKDMCTSNHTGPNGGTICG